MIGGETAPGEEEQSARVGTGLEGLDNALKGGYPSKRTVLLEGGPGVGKTTVAMQFLQAGLDAGERCLFLSTEQGRSEFEASVGGFPFEIDHENFTFTSIHVQEGRPNEDLVDGNYSKRFGDAPKGLVMRTLDGQSEIDDKRVEFNASNIRQYISRLGSFDRVVFDSVSGFGTMTDSETVFRKSVLDLVRLCSEEFGATSLFTAEGHEGGRKNPLRYNAHGVVLLQQDVVRGSERRFLKVSKMRGVANDSRRYELDIDTAHGVRLRPQKRTRDADVNPFNLQPTGMPGLDQILGGGLPAATPVLIETDGHADVDVIWAALMNRALEAGYALNLVIPSGWGCGVLDNYIDGDHTVESLMEANRLFVVSGSARPTMPQDNVFVMEESTTVEMLLQNLGAWAARNERTWWSMTNFDTLQDFYSPGEVKRLWRMFSNSPLESEQMITTFSNKNNTEQAYRDFNVNIASQVVEIHQEDDGLTYAHLSKSPSGHVGSTALVDYVNEPPYVQFF